MMDRVKKNPLFQKSPTHWVFGVLLGFGLYSVFGFFYSKEQLGSYAFI